MKQIFSFLFSILILVTSCNISKADSPINDFEDNSYFFLGLQEADNENEEKAIRYFTIARDSKNCSEIIRRRSAESLTMIGNVIDRFEAAKELAKIFNDNEAFLVAVREFEKQKEYSEIINITNDLDFSNAPNELVEFRLNALLEKKDKRFEHEYFEWIISRPLSPEHIEFYQKYLANKVTTFQQKQAEAERKYNEDLEKRIEEWKKDFLEKNPDTKIEDSQIPTQFDDLKMEIVDLPMTDEQSIINFRVFVHKRNYTEAFRVYNDIIDIYRKQLETEKESENENEDKNESKNKTSENKNLKLQIHDQILSDIGKAVLYGTKDYFSSGRKLDEIAKELDDEKSFFMYFYAARLYDKGGRYQKTASNRFKTAIEVTTDPKRFDQALWYLLNFQLCSSTDDIIDTLKTYGSKISDPEYFDDFFESLSVLLLSSQRWQDFYKVWKETDSNFSPNTAGKYAYISGRLMEEGLATGAKDLKTRQVVDAFMKVISGKGNIYYKVCALERLNISDKEIIELVLRNGKEDETETDSQKLIDDSEIENDKNKADILLSGYSAFGFPQRMYPEWRANKKDISIQEAVKASKFLFDCGKFNPIYNTQSLRIAAQAKDKAVGKLPIELLELLYPQFYSKEIAEVCKEYELNEYLLYALVRTESFFEANASSVAGASGLTQLMESTAKDEAKKLKLSDDFDILDPETNLKIGGHYLKNLINRVEENNPILALFAYNGGLTNVKKWLKTSKNDWAKLGKTSTPPAGISMDLFLEMLPFTETRDYGRQLVASSTMYAWLYYEKTPAEVVREILYSEK